MLSTTRVLGGASATLTIDEPELFPVFVSPPPETEAVLVIEAGAVGEIFTSKLISREAPAAKAVVLVQLRAVAVVAVQINPATIGDVAIVSPVGIVSVTEKVAVVGPLPEFVGVIE